MTDPSGLDLSVFLQSSKQPCYDWDNAVTDAEDSAHCIGIPAEVQQIPAADANSLADRIASQMGSELWRLEPNATASIDVGEARCCVSNTIEDSPKGAVVFTGQLVAGSMDAIVSGCCRPGEFGDNWCVSTLATTRNGAQGKLISTKQFFRLLLGQRPTWRGDASLASVGNGAVLKRYSSTLVKLREGSFLKRGGGRL